MKFGQTIITNYEIHLVEKVCMGYFQISNSVSVLSHQNIEYNTFQSVTIIKMYVIEVNEKFFEVSG
eukprot:snap_masked-scaffold_3-processed-gene-11.22-mRNA-1 protein AED:1.00 eAED:1.00 QI:0/0/0/0/1/1/2/0/65